MQIDIITTIEKIADHSFHHLTFHEANTLGAAMRDASEAVASYNGHSPALRVLAEFMLHLRVRSAEAFREEERRAQG